jgi:hypothetical protein
VNSTDVNGTVVRGFLVDVRDNGYPVASGYTPVTFNGLEPGVNFQVVVYWAGNYYFRHFSDGNLNRYELVTLNSTTASQKSISFDAEYQDVPSKQAASLMVQAEYRNGSVIGQTFNVTDYIQHTPGVWVTVIPPHATTPFTGSYTGGSLLPFILLKGQSYTMQMTLSYGGYTFAYWKDTNSTDATRSIVLGGNESYIAVYNYTPPSNGTSKSNPDGIGLGGPAMAIFGLIGSMPKIRSPTGGRVKETPT